MKMIDVNWLLLKGTAFLACLFVSIFMLYSLFSSTNAKKWEIELQTLKSNNTRLTNALQESTANVEEWKRQLQALKDENTKMKHKVLRYMSTSQTILLLYFYVVDY